MNHRYLLSILTLVFSIAIDQVSKEWASEGPGLHYNESFIMGLYSGLPDYLRILALSSFAGFVFFIYGVFLYVLPARAKVVRLCLSLVVGGMFGNVIDKMLLGKTIDFIPLNLSGMKIVFNLADVFLWIGALGLFYIVLKKDRLIWYPETTRRNFLILPREQYRTGLNYALISFSCAILLGIFSYTFFKVAFAPYIAASEKLMVTFFVSYCMITVLFCSAAFFTGVVLSHRTAGPVYAFENYIDDLIKGNDRKLTLREGDNFKQLEKVADRLRDYLKNNRQ